jgi:hypothetical protein
MAKVWDNQRLDFDGEDEPTEQNIWRSAWPWTDINKTQRRAVTFLALLCGVVLVTCLLLVFAFIAY